MTEAYFSTLSAALREARAHEPTLVLDLERLRANLRIVTAGLETAGLPLRVVDKSLPCLDLLALVADVAGTARFMSFHLPIATAVLDRFRGAESLLGKPMPVEGARLTLERRPDLASRIVWLVDTEERLAEYGALSADLDTDLACCFEVDVGLHRGGFATPEALVRALGRLEAHPRLRCRGIVAYEAHIGHVPRFVGGPVVALAKAKRRLRDFLACLDPERQEIVNLGGSSTARLYDGSEGATELSLGSAFVKPSDFDVPSLAALEAALFIATPILKVVDPQAPGLDGRTRVLQRLGRFPRHGCFLYGGKWLATAVHPPGLSPFGSFFASTNQQFMALPRDSRAVPGDYAFLRPTQSESVMQQFGSLAVFAGGRIVERWPVLAPA